MKKLVSMILATAIALTALTACSSTPKDEKKELIIWNAGIQTSDDTGAVDKKDMPVYALIAEFEKTHPDYKVTLVDYGMDDLNKAFTSANMAKKGPDMVSIWAGSTTQAYQDYLIDFNQYLSDSEQETFDISSLLHKNNSSQEALIGLRYGLDATGVLYINKEIFAQNNIEVPTKWSELVDVSEKLKAAGVTPLILGDKDGHMSTWVTCSMLGNMVGPDGIRDMVSGGSIKMTGSEFTNALKTWKEYVDAGFTNVDFLTKNTDDALVDFVQGKGAMMIHGNWASTSFDAMGENVDLYHIPVLDDTAFADYMYSQPNINLAITNYSPNIDAAVDFAKMLADSEFTEKSNAALYSKETAARLSRKSDELTGEGKNVTGFDSIVTGEAANEFYKLVPTYLKGNMTLEELTAQLDSLN